MDDSRMDRLSRLAELRASGVLSDAEFDAEKAKLLNRSNRWPIYLGVGALVIAGAAGLSLWTMQGIEPPPPVRPHATVSPSSMPSTSPVALPSPAMAVRTPAQELGDAFLAATGHADAYTDTADGQSTTTSPVRVIALPFGRALLTKTETKDGCHACSGYIGVYYLSGGDGSIKVAKSFPEAVPGWAWGASPDYEVTTRFTANPAIYSSGGDMHQGYAESGAMITELTPAGPAKSDVIGLGSDNSGAVGDDSEQLCSVEGTIANIVKDRSFDVVMKGGAPSTVRYVKRGGRFVAAGKDQTSCV